jgi:hypothetical protein
MEEQHPKWTVERVHKELSEARNKLFVVAKVAETGSIPFQDHPEWMLVLKPLLRDLVTYSQTIEEAMGEVPLRSDQQE